MDKIYDLSLWNNNKIIQNKIKAYLCEKNGGKLRYKSYTGNVITLYSSFLGIKSSHDYKYFLDKIESLENFQMHLKDYFKNKLDYNKTRFYIVSVQMFKTTDEILCPRIYHFNNKSEALKYAYETAINFGFNISENDRGYYKEQINNINYLITTQKGINK